MLYDPLDDRTLRRGCGADQVPFDVKDHHELADYAPRAARIVAISA